MNTLTGLMPLMVGALLVLSAASPVLLQTADNPNSPDQTVKLIFIHHSTGENWLTDGYGDLGRTLGENNYFVSDTNYGWGPDAIGDRTDIPDWPEWFASENTSLYIEALFNESGQNSSYTRELDDPGGENEIIMFKSCFPNSALEGNPNDPPDPEGWLSVGHAKYVYNEILQFFATRPDKLFIVITAPPLSDPTYAENARAFNHWLLNDWLSENNYSLNNVAVFDFYNILTGADAHHRYNNGQVEHIVGGDNTLYYPSGDDHPSEAGSQKATDEFVPLLNVFYHRWKGNKPPENQPVINPASETESQPQEAPAPLTSPGWVADFDNIILYLSTYWDESSDTHISCDVSDEYAYSGTTSLKIEFDVTPSAWATCVLSFDAVQDWSTGQGLVFAIHAKQADIPYDVNIYTGVDEARETYLDSAATPGDSVDGWATVEIPWYEFHRADWEADAGTVFSKPDQINEIAFGFNGLEDGNNTNIIWVDDLRLMGQEIVSPVEQPVEEAPSKPALPCVGVLALPLAIFGLVRWKGRKQ